MWEYATAFSLLLFVGRCRSWKEDLPEHLIECYNSQTGLYPMTMTSLIDLVRELENHMAFSYNPASLAALLLYQFTVDGVERNPGSTPVYHHGVVPFTVSGSQRYRDRVLKHNFLPPDYSNIPQFLTHLKKCSLHMLMSSSVDLWERGDENRVCPHLEQQIQWLTGEPFGNKMSSCPVEMGIVWYNNHAVSPNRIFAAVLAVLRPVNLQVESGNRTEFVAPLSSLWASTLAGDLASVALMQSVEDVSVGAQGYWNDSILPTNYYLIADNHVVSRRKWQLTRAQILGDIDGLMIALQVEKNKFQNMRLSQILESFYEEHGLTGSESNACGRRHFYKQQILTRLPLIHHQSLQMAMLMRSMCTECVYHDRAALDSGITRALDSLRNFLDQNLTGVECEATTRYPRVRLYVIFDSTFSSYDKLRSFMRLANMVDVSEYGSRITLINGQTGSVVVNDASTTGQLYSDWLNASHFLTDVEYLDISRSMTTLNHILNKSKYKTPGYRDDAIVIYSHVTVVLAPSSTMSSKDLETAQNVLVSLLHQHPEQRVLFVSSALMMPVYKSLIRYYNAVQRCEVLVFHPSHQQARELLKFLNKVRRELIPEMCIELPANEGDGQRTSASTSRYSELLVPFQWHRYIIEPEYMCTKQSSSMFDLQFQLSSISGGDVEICLGWPDHQEHNCKYLSHGTITLSHQQTCLPGPHHCPPVYLQLRANRSHTCYEAGCRTGTEVKVELQVSGLSCLTSDRTMPICRSAALSLRFQVAVVTLSQYFSLIMLRNIY